MTDSDGNKVTRPGTVGVVTSASVQPISSTEDDDGSTETRYRLRLAGGWPAGGGILGSRAQVEWRGKRYSIDGDAQLHTGSPRTAHATYVMVRS
ncbi:hypothetical protein [Mycolicibacterium madagascariense]|uniref:hypothetical protein n=1 Tax=Mycolicibacterium madagascariense TaxID=212765 RepID=UPI0013D6C348|nr:hypothetical protein [Mycolicibacterium madagascariense]MCV7015556.1 hypothetical protein [Mycolicibacterium madagascariense]